MKKVTSVYITCKNKSEAVKIAKILVKEKLAACANILSSIESIYEWERKINHTKETAMLVKTKTKLVPALTKRVKEIHSYECPCIVSFGIKNGNRDFIEWIMTSTKTI